MKGCGDRGDYKTYCWGIFNLNCSQKIYYYFFPFFALRFFFFFFASGNFDDFVSSKTR